MPYMEDLYPFIRENSNLVNDKLLACHRTLKILKPLKGKILAKFYLKEKVVYL